MADRLGSHRHRRLRPVICATDDGNWCDHLRSMRYPVRELVLVRFPRLPVRALSDPNPRASGGIRLFMERFSAIFSGFIIAFFLRKYGTPGVFGLIAAAMIAVFIIVGFFGPAVTRRRLESIAS